MNEDLLERASWTWGLSLIALTVAIHALGVVMMALVMEKIRVHSSGGKTESDTGMVGANSNWRGPIWMPANVVLIRAATTSRMSVRPARATG